MINIDPIRAAIAPYMLLIKLGLVVVLAASMFIGGCSHGAAKWKGKYQEEAQAREHDQIEFETVIQQMADASKAAEAAAKAAGEKAAADRKVADKQFQEKANEAEQAKRDLRAALRNGTGPVRLRDEWAACPASGSAQGDDPATASRQDANADLRAAGAADLVAAGQAADSWIVWLQSELTSTRKACSL